MAKGFKHGAGGIPLNFKVVGGTSAPSNPKQNTIWVNTGNEITAWAFSADEPNMTKNIVKTTYVNTSVSVYVNVLYIDAELVPNTTYTLSFNGAAGNVYYVNENIAARRDVVVKSGRASVTFTTKSTLNKSDTTQFDSVRGKWITLKNSQAQTSAHIFNNVQVEKGSSHDGNYVPYGGIEGGVWFPTATSRSTEFNALKKNGIQVYPLSAKQYVGGAWVSKGVKIHQFGAWNNFSSIIVPNINTVWVNSNAVVEKTATETKLTLTVKAPKDGTQTTTTSYTEIDTTGYDTLYIACTLSVNNTTGSAQASEVYLKNPSASGVVSSVYYTVINAGTNSGTVNYSKKIDISALSGIYRVACDATTWTSTSLNHYITITDCRMY